MPPTDGRQTGTTRSRAVGSEYRQLGKADSAFTNWLQRITDIAVPSGSNLQNLNLPIGPNAWSTIDTRALLRRNREDARGRATLRQPASTTRLNRARSAVGAITASMSTSRSCCPSGGSYLIG